MRGPTQASYLAIVMAMAPLVQAALRSPAVFLTMALLAGTVACSPAAPSRAEVLGTWEKPDTSLPPISLTLSSDGASTRARLRLSGVELHGTAVVEGDRLHLTFTDRPPIVGRFTSKTTLTLRFDHSSPEYALQKQGT